MNKLIQKIFIPAVLLVLNFQPVYAQTPIPIGEIYFNGYLAGKNLTYFINPLVRASMILAGIIAFILVLAGGFGMVASAGNTQQQGKGKQAVTAGVAGLFIVFSAYWILEIIQTLTGVDILSGSGL